LHIAAAFTGFVAVSATGTAREFNADIRRLTFPTNDSTYFDHAVTCLADCQIHPDPSTWTSS
jgi:hypothetical protein